jgi:phage protein D
MPQPASGPSYTLLVAVAGQPLPADVAQLLANGYVDMSAAVPDLFVLKFTDSQQVVMHKAGFDIGKQVKLTVQGADNQPAATLLEGEITALETEIDASGTHLVVRGYDTAHRLFRGRRVDAYVNMTVGDIARRIAQQAGLQVGTVTSKGPVLPHVTQNGLSDWEFLTSLANTVGAEVTVADGKLQFRDRPTVTSAPAGQQDSQQNALVLEYGRNLVALRATVTAADQVPSVEVRGWDPKAKAAVVGSAQAATSGAQLSQVAPDRLASTVQSHGWLEADSRVRVQAQANDRAAAIADRLGGAFTELDATLNGNPDLKPGAAVSLAGVGDPFDGKYALTCARHEFSPETGYRTFVTVSNSSERSLLGITAGVHGAAPARADRGVTGVMVGIVTNAKDPEQLGRVKLKLPMLSDDYESGWARVLQLGAGGKRGVVWLPEVGDEVLVAFGTGHADDPYVLGGVFNGKDKPDKDWGDHVDGNGAITRRALVSRSGMLVELVEASGEERLTISTNSGAQKITLDQKSKGITIASEGPVTVTAKQDINLQTDTGTVSIKGNKVSVEATTDVAVKGVNATVEASAQLQLKGTAAKLNGTATAEIQAALVKIN